MKGESEKKYWLVHKRINFCIPKKVDRFILTKTIDFQVAFKTALEKSLVY